MPRDSLTGIEAVQGAKELHVADDPKVMDTNDTVERELSSETLSCVETASNTARNLPLLVNKARAQENERAEGEMR